MKFMKLKGKRRSGEQFPLDNAVGGGTSEDVWIPTICHCCNHGPDLIRVHRINGVAVELEGNTQGERLEDLAKNQGTLCPKAYGVIQKLYNPDRIKAPLKRTNLEKGPGVDPKWVEINWEEALDTIAEKLRKIRAEDSKRLSDMGALTQFHTHCGTWRAFFEAFGSTNRLSTGAGVRCEGAQHAFGNLIHGGWSCDPDLTHCNYILFIGSNRLTSGGVGGNRQIAEARARGMKMVVVDPVYTLSAGKADEWLPIKPGTDGAFLLALIHVILHELKIYDVQFLKSMTNAPYLVGPDGYFLRERETQKPLVWDSREGRAKNYDDGTINDFALEGAYLVDGLEGKPVLQVLKEHVKGYNPEWASSITDIPAGTIRRIAKEWVDNARIGSTITLDGVTWPYRPVATDLGRGITGVMRSYQNILANHILAALVGSLEAVGGHCGGRVRLGEIEADYGHRGVVPGPDGMLNVEKRPFAWPPVSYSGEETLLPFTSVIFLLNHLAYLNLAEPPKNFPMPPTPLACLRHRANPLTGIGEPHVVVEALKKIPFLVSIAYVIDEVSELADIVLPDHTDLERFQLSISFRRAFSKRYAGLSLRQPVVKPLYNTKDIADILTELADRIGFLSEYNQAINSLFHLTEPYQLEPTNKYEWVDIVNRHCKSATGGAHDLEWFKENGALLRPVSAPEIYEVHQEMTAKKLRYPIPYMEEVKKTGEDLACNLAEAGVDWWPTAEYVALPTYFPPVLDGVPPEFDFYITHTRSQQIGWSSNVEIPLMIEAAENIMPGQTDIMMNAGAASARGINDGDEMWVESEVGKVKRKVKLTEGIRPDTLLISGAFGQWATPIAKDTGRVSLTTLTPNRREWTDPVAGSMQGNLLKVKIYKA